MFKELGFRGSGKTRKLLEYADKHNMIIIEPTASCMRYAQVMAHELGLNVKAITISEYLSNWPYHANDRKFLVDELSMFLNNMNIAGYSDTVGFACCSLK